MSLLEVIAVSKSYSLDAPAVRDVSLGIEDGEILCLLGPSGCGKTTLLRMIAGLERPDQGRIMFEGRDMGKVPPHERGFGMMFQDFALFPHKSVRENVAFGLRMQHMATPELDRRVVAMLELVDLARLGERQVAEISGGEQQRVALARALAPGPRLLMLDEPLGALDRALRERLMLDARAILKRVGMTAIYVTHDQTEAFAVGDRLAVMNRGQIIQVGKPLMLYQQPATPFVAKFLGFQNLVNGFVDEDGSIVIPVGHFRLRESEPTPGKTVTLLIKPDIEAISENSQAVPQPENTIDGTLDAVIFRGRYLQVWVSVQGYRLLFEEYGDFPFQPGDSIRLTVSSSQLLLYESLPQ